MTPLKIIHNEADYNAALKRIESLMDIEYGSPEGDELELLALLVSTFEDEQFPIDVPDAITAIRFIMDQRGYEQKDLAALFGKARASEILNKKRDISLNQARILHKEWGVPAEALLTT